MPNTDFSYQIVERIAILSQNGTVSKELNRISYNSATPKWDLRSWKREDGQEKLLKGLTLTNEEISALKAALNTRADI